MPRYRWRTRLRTHLPFALLPLAPKGTKDCGAHEWYRSSPDLYLCYHCTAGHKQQTP